MPRLAACLLCLALCSSSSWGRDPRETPKLLWKEPSLPFRLGDPGASSLPVLRAAQAALHYFNYKLGSPSSLRAPEHVKKASVKDIPGVGKKYFLQFSTKDLQTGQKLGLCLASVFYLKTKPKPTVEIICTRNKDPDQRQREDYSLYLSIRDSVEPSLDDLWALGTVGSSYIAWEKATVDSSYIMTQIKNVKQWRRADESLEFDYSILLSSGVSESLSCHMRLIWKLGLPMKVKYECSAEDESSGFGDGSGAEQGSTSGFFIEPESNFLVG
nr:PREDICTED: retinoic acid receptor responder protein 1 [Anolis carolinensis]|eukprot:XP_016847517.1 PREDICTED: retinoic acid receptor responder protein 1 [Anolis carolinensis]